LYLKKSLKKRSGAVTAATNRLAHKPVPQAQCECDTDEQRDHDLLNCISEPANLAHIALVSGHSVRNQVPYSKDSKDLENYEQTTFLDVTLKKRKK
jgi:hypothetical protein